MMARMRFTALTLCFVSAGVAEKLPKPDRVGAPATPEESALIDRGVALHDKHDYPGAIAIYKQVLADSPSQVTALYEMSYSLFSSGNYEESLAVARNGIQYRSEKLPFFYVMMGNSLDELGKGAEAMELYRWAAKQNPGVEMLHYNLGISLFRAGKKAEARPVLQTALRLAPNHASAHAALAADYRDTGYRVPAILAYSRFLVLEPDSERAANVLPVLQQLIAGGVSASDSSHINLRVSDGKGVSDEGNFGGAEMGIAIVTAATLMAKPATGENAKISAFDRLVSVYDILGESLRNSKPKGGFAASYYSPWFAALQKAGHTQAFLSETWKAGNVEGLAEWAAANGEKVRAFRIWSEQYAWPAK